jgi:regulator of cell morphogenesis and NO signaling
MQKHVLTISDIVRKDYRTADVFRKHGINYCCGGNSTLEEACSVKNLDVSTVEAELSAVAKNIVIPSSIRFDEWSIDFLIDYIINVHHAYLKDSLPAVEIALRSFVNGHRKKFPFLEELEEAYTSLAELLLEHMKEEEQKIFPYIKQISHTHKHKETYGRLFVKTLSKSLTQVIEFYHTRISARLIQLRNFSSQYQFDDTACTNHRVVFQKLKELDDDIVQHKFLENSVLFPKAINMERDLLNL